MNNHTPPSSPSPRDNNDALDRLLRESATRSAPIADDGFSNRVLHALPPRHRPARPLSLRATLCFLGAITGILLSLKNAPRPFTSSGPLSLADHFTTILIDVSTWLTAPAQLTLFGTLTLVAGIIFLLDERVRRWL